jgi:hypothetical protein
MESQVKSIEHYLKLNEQADKDWVMNRVNKSGSFSVTKRTATSYIKAADTLVTEGLLQRKGLLYTKKV